MLRVGSECTTWLLPAEEWCARPATHMRLDAETGEIESVLCDAHRQPRDVPIPPSVKREQPSTFWADFRRRWRLS